MASATSALALTTTLATMPAAWSSCSSRDSSNRARPDTADPEKEHPGLFLREVRVTLRRGHRMNTREAGLREWLEACVVCFPCSPPEDIGYLRLTFHAHYVAP